MTSVTLCVTVEANYFLVCSHFANNPLSSCLLTKYEVNNIFTLVIQKSKPVDSSIITHKDTDLVNSLCDIDLCRRLLFVKDFFCAKHRTPDTICEHKLHAAQCSAALLVVDLRKLYPLMLRKFLELLERRPLEIALE